jgi:Zn-dependent protease
MLLAAVVASVTFHEFSHALTATTLGDKTAQRQGRLSLNPKAHLDPAGSIMFLLAGFGWGKPVPVNAYAFGANALKGMMLVAFAGPLSNFVLAFLIGLLFKLGIVEWPFNVVFTPIESSAPLSLIVGQFFAMWLFLNLILGVFNLIPLAPLDGSKVAAGLLPKALAIPLLRMEPYGPGILLVIIMLDIMLGVGIIAWLVGPPIRFLQGIVL